MLGKFGLAAAVLLISAAPALADNCGGAPIAPAPVDGSKATEAQLVAASHDANDFMKTSDQYQQCLADDLTRQKREAAKAKDPKPLDPAIEQASNAKTNENQRMKEKVGAEFHASLIGYCSRKDANPADCKSVPK